MKEIEKFLIWLSQFNLPSKKIDEILSVVQSFEISDFSKQQGLDKFLKFQDLEYMRSQSNSLRVREYFDALEKSEIQVLTCVSKEFPEKLKNIPNPPSILFCKGDLSLLNSFSIAVVGTRKPSNYGRTITERITKDLASSGVTIISGLAYGIDSIAHKKTLDMGGKTIAVLGGGFNHIYPPAHTDLSKTISEKGLLISEYPPSVKPQNYMFIERNRIVAGLSSGVLITEGDLKSGTRSTKDFALESGRDVFAVPGNITERTSDLPNLLISCGHAKCVLSAKDILDEYNITEKPKTTKVSDISAQEEIILDLLKNGEKDMVYLQENSGFDVKNLNSYLTFLEIRGLIKKLPGNSYVAI